MRSRSRLRPAASWRTRPWVGLVLVLALAVSACAPASRSTEVAAPSPRSSAAAEPTAGRWRTWVLASGGQVAVDPPPSPGSPASDREEQELQGMAARRTSAMADAVHRWGGRGRPVSAPWMEMALGFVAAREKDPPASSRAYALVAVAAYDAMVAAWNAKYAYNRPVPAAARPLDDPGPDPSYPNEHAAVAGAASRVLAHLFPEQPAPRLEAAAAEAADSRVWAGAARRSDVDAGLALGRAVAADVIGYARADGSDRVWDGTRPPGIGRGPRFWEPQPGSVANPVSPLAGTWKPWVLTSGRQLRPGPPPAFGTPEFLAQAREVVEVKRGLTEEQKRAATFWAGGRGTPLPAGIWNQVVLALLDDLRPTRPQAERALALANVAMADAGIAAWDAKYAYWDPRPENGVRDAGIEPGWEPYLVDTPFFPSYISGHSTYSGAVAEVLSYLFPHRTKDFHDTALEASSSRLWGGIHWRRDAEVGLDVGRRIGLAVVERAKADGAPAS